MKPPFLSIDSYDADKRSLTVAFRDGGKYSYSEVSPGHYRAFVDAPDQYQHFRTRIMSDHPCTKCPR